MEIERRIKLLAQSVWSVKEIMEYFDLTHTTAHRVKGKAIKLYDGSVPYGNQYVLTDAVLQLWGTSRAKEIEALKELMGISSEK